MYNYFADKKRIDWLHQNYSSPEKYSVQEFVKLVNESYYKNSVELYQQRYVDDIEDQYSKLFLKLDIANKPNPVIVNIGGGSGFEYSQFIKNNISFDQYHYIEPDAFMVDKFQKLFKINNKDSNVFIHNKSFDEVVDEISSLPNKIILMNSCFHHLIWVKEFLDLIKSSMRPGDSFVVCHEPDNSYANSLLMYINYFIRFIFTDFLLRRLRLKKSKKTIDDKERWQNINNDLVESGVLNQSVKPLIIRRIIDYGANNKGDWKYLTVPASYNEGYWLPSDIAEYFEEDCTLSYFNTYRHLGDAGNNKILRFLNRLLSSLFRKGGSAFCMVLKRSE